MKPISITELRSNIYKLAKEVSEKGKVIEIKRGNTILQLKVKKPDAFAKKDKKYRDLSKLPKMNVLVDGFDLDNYETEWEWNTPKDL